MAIIDYNNFGTRAIHYPGNKTLNISITSDVTLSNFTKPLGSLNVYNATGVIELITDGLTPSDNQFPGIPFGFANAGFPAQPALMGTMSTNLFKHNPALIYSTNPLYILDDNVLIPTECVDFTEQKDKNWIEVVFANDYNVGMYWGTAGPGATTMTILKFRQLDFYDDITYARKDILDDDIIQVVEVGHLSIYAQVPSLITQTPVDFYIRRVDFTQTETIPTSFGGTVDFTISGVWS